MGLFNCCKLANLSWDFITTTSKQRPKTSRRKLCCEKLGTSHDLKSSATGSFLECFVVRIANDLHVSLLKTLNTLVKSVQHRSISSEISPENFHEIGEIRNQIVFWQSYLNNSHFLLSPRWPLWKGSIVFKNTLEVWKLCSILNFLFSLFRQKRIPKINCLKLGWGRSSDVEKWLQQYRGVAEVKDIMTAGKRSQAKVARLVCKPSLVMLSVLTYWILQKKRFSSGLMFADAGQEVIRICRAFAEILS